MGRVRLAVPADADAIARVHVASWRTTYRGLMPDEVLDSLSVERRRDWWQGVIENPEQIEVAVAEESGQVVGFASYGAERADDPVYRGELDAIYLLKDHQRKGWGRSLVAAAVRGLLKRGLSGMLVWVLSDNPACSFYENLGGVYLRRKPLEISGVSLQESAYGWIDIHPLAVVG
jgi:L-amino acid N-acyltransferase YncA